MDLIDRNQWTAQPRSGDRRCPECGANNMDHWPWCSQYKRPVSGRTTTTLRDFAERRMPRARFVHERSPFLSQPA
jgi:hypothetical protein